MDDRVLAGVRVLVAGEDLGAVHALRERLSALGADSTALAGDPDAVAAAAQRTRPEAILALDASAAALRDRLDPFGLEAGPPVIDLESIAGAEAAVGSLAGRRLLAQVESRALRARLAEADAVLAAQAVARRRAADESALETLRRLAAAAEYRDDNTREHTQRVGHLAARLARAVGLSDRVVWLVRHAAPLHDLGKIAIPDEILLKQGRLSAEEYELVKTHAMLGARVLAGGTGDLLETAEAIVAHHHERWDGTGYPDALAGADIPVAARLVHVADVFDVLVHERPHKEAWTVEAAADEIRAAAGSQFDPEVVGAFEGLGPRAWREEPVPA